MRYIFWRRADSCPELSNSKHQAFLLAWRSDKGLNSANIRVSLEEDLEPQIRLWLHFDCSWRLCSEDPAKTRLHSWQHRSSEAINTRGFILWVWGNQLYSKKRWTYREKSLTRPFAHLYQASLIRLFMNWNHIKQSHLQVERDTIPRSQCPQRPEVLYCCYPITHPPLSDCSLPHSGSPLPAWCPHHMWDQTSEPRRTTCLLCKCSAHYPTATECAVPSLKHQECLIIPAAAGISSFWGCYLESLTAFQRSVSIFSFSGPRKKSQETRDHLSRSYLQIAGPSWIRKSPNDLLIGFQHSTSLPFFSNIDPVLIPFVCICVVWGSALATSFLHLKIPCDFYPYFTSFLYQNVLMSRSSFSSPRHRLLHPSQSHHPVIIASLLSPVAPRGIYYVPRGNFYFPLMAN